jgi:hypothetical protein
VRVDSARVADSASSAGSVDYNNLTNKTGGTGTYTTSGDYRAPIFYDSNNTGYYVDPAGTSNLSVAQLLNGKWYPVDNGSGNSIEIYVRPDNNNTYVWRHIYGGTGTGFGTGVGGYGIYAQHLGGDYSLLFNAAGYVTAPYSLRSPIFYDSNNTAWYVDPASTSILSKLAINNSSTSFGGQLTVRNAGAGYNSVFQTSDFSAASAGSQLVIQPNPVATTGNTLFCLSVDHAGGLTPNAGAIIIGYNGGYVGINGVSTPAFQLDVNGTGRATSDFRAPIFYDSANTAYYVDPTSLSNLTTVNTQNAVSNNVNGLRNVNPGGGSYVTSASSVSGAIKITLPQTVFPMIRFTVRVFTYDNLSFDIYCGGHTSSGTWYNTFAYMTTQNRPALNVRFTYGGGSVFVYIGELGSSWSYPQVFITDVQVGYTNYEYDRWDDGWVIGFDASTYNNVSSTHTVFPPPSSSNNTNAIYTSILYDANNTGYYVDPASTSRMNAINYDNLYYAGNTSYGFFGTNVYADTINSGAVGDPLELCYYRGSFTTTSGSMRAPLFYDLDNTGYYLDPASTSNLNVLAVQRAYAGYDAGVTNSFSCSDWFRSSGASGWYNASYAGGIFMQDSTWVRVYNSKAFLAEDTIQSNSSVRGPIFYDSNNTAYYADFAATGDSIRAAGNIVAYYSDERLKKHLGKIENALDKVDQLEGFYYEANEVAQKLGYKAKREVGVSAQAVQRVLPEIVTDAPIDARYLTIDYERLVPLLIEAIKELTVEVKTLKSKVH